MFRVPSVDEMIAEYTSGGAAGLSKSLEARHALLEPTLRWIITSNRAHIRYLEPHERIKGLGTDNQFVMLGASPQHEWKFQMEKSCTVKSRSSIWAWHGSHFKNWHSIVRTSLKNMSGTKYQAHGASYGKGIYLAKKSGTSLGYSKFDNSGMWPLSKLGKTQPQVLALCEIVNHRNLPKPNPYYVIPIEHWVATRFLVVHNSESRRHNVDANEAATKIPRKLMESLQGPTKGDL
uniref:PARP catalytic domain-containing protein n=1 Tax=Lotharella globosa TaxID=91324 RepID=A0A7S4DSE0_9EUKA